MNKYYFLIDNMLWGWAERVVSNLAKEYLKLWKDVYLFTLTKGLFYNIPQDVHYIHLSNLKNCRLATLLVPLFSLKFKYYLKKFWLNEGISFLETSNFVHILSKKNAWISFRIHIDYYNKGPYWKFWKILIKWLYPKAGKIIVNSRENKYDLARFLWIRNNKIDVWYNSFDKENMKLLSNEGIEDNLIDIIKNKKVFITTWRLARQKHHDKIINALFEYNKKEKNWIYLIIWDWEKRWELENLVKSLLLNNQIVFLWQKKNVFKYLKHADLYLYASEIEWFPNALLEAREMWLKIISSDFKSWAREVIFWENTDTIWKNLQYPVEWKYWVLIDWDNYTQQIQKYI